MYKSGQPPILTKHEKRLEDAALKAGYEVLRGGWPDFLLVKGSEVLFIEVKHYDSFTPLQKRVFRILQDLGLDIRVSVDGSINTTASLDASVKFRKKMYETKRTRTEIRQEMVLKEAFNRLQDKVQ